MVREINHERHFIQLCDFGHVSALRRQRVWQQEMQDSENLRRRHLRLLHHRNVYQNDCHGFVWQRLLLVRDLESSRLLHRFGWVSFLNYDVSNPIDLAWWNGKEIGPSKWSHVGNLQSCEPKQSRFVATLFPNNSFWSYSTCLRKSPLGSHHTQKLCQDAQEKT